MLSNTVAKALTFREGKDAEATVQFITKMNKFFDCLNVGNFDDGKRKRDPFKQPYRSARDFRLQVSVATEQQNYTEKILIIAHYYESPHPRTYLYHSGSKMSSWCISTTGRSK